MYAEHQGARRLLRDPEGTALFSATAMHLAEGKIQAGKLGTIPDVKKHHHHREPPHVRASSESRPKIGGKRHPDATYW